MKYDACKEFGFIFIRSLYVNILKHNFEMEVLEFKSSAIPSEDMYSISMWGYINGTYCASTSPIKRW